MTRLKDLEANLEQTEKQLRLLQKISRLMARDNGLGETLQRLVSLVVEFMESDSCLLYLLQGQELVLCASNNPQPDTIGKVRLKFGDIARSPQVRAIGSRRQLSDDVEIEFALVREVKPCSPPDERATESRAWRPVVHIKAMNVLNRGNKVHG